VLAKIKRDPDLRRIPVVSLTSSAAKQDILQVYHLHAIGSVTKDARAPYWLAPRHTDDAGDPPLPT
jgi:CheY-like chemotaxis protein